VIQGPGRYVIYDNILETDDDGSIDYVGLHFTASGSWPVGAYIFSVDDLEETFEVKR
jgi:hypothetical protein